MLRHRNRNIWFVAAATLWAVLGASAFIGANAEPPPTVPLTERVSSEVASDAVIGLGKIRGQIRNLTPAQLRDTAPQLAAWATERAELLRQRAGSIDLQVAVALDEVAAVANDTAAGRAGADELLTAIDRLDDYALSLTPPRTPVPAERIVPDPDPGDLPDPGTNTPGRPERPVLR